MRPRVIPAENPAEQRMETLSAVRFNEAAGNPRGKRRDRSLSQFPSLDRFNEAAGNPRGKRCSTNRHTSSGGASMRPRVIPAENLLHDGRRRCRRSGFNEAAGNPRGKQELVSSLSLLLSRFNEAAGNPRGKPTDPTRPRRPSRASMRPRVIPAENRARRRAWPRGSAGLQ